MDGTAVLEAPEFTATAPETSETPEVQESPESVESTVADSPESVMVESPESTPESTPKPFDGAVVIRKGPSQGVNFVLLNGKMIGMVASFNRFEQGTKWFIPSAPTAGTKMSAKYATRAEAVTDLVNATKEKNWVMARKKAEARVATPVSEEAKVEAQKQLDEVLTPEALAADKEQTTAEVQAAEAAGEQDAVASEIDNLIAQVGNAPEGTVPARGGKSKEPRAPKEPKVGGGGRTRDKVYLILRNIPGYPKGYAEHESLTAAYENAQAIVADLKTRGIVLKRGGDRGWDRTWTAEAIAAAPASEGKPEVQAQPERAIYYSKVNPDPNAAPVAHAPAPVVSETPVASVAPAAVAAPVAESEPVVEATEESAPSGAPPRDPNEEVVVESPDAGADGEVQSEESTSEGEEN